MTDGISHRAIDWACPLCARQPGHDCDWSDWQFAQPHPEFHAERIAIANSIATGEGYTPTLVEFDKAVEDSGLV